MQFLLIKINDIIVLNEIRQNMKLFLRLEYDGFVLGAIDKMQIEFHEFDYFLILESGMMVPILDGVDSFRFFVFDETASG